jgi:hypothetical protein
MDAETLEFWAQFARLDIDSSRQPYRSNRQALVLFSSSRMRDTQCIDMLNLMVRCLLLAPYFELKPCRSCNKSNNEAHSATLAQVVSYTCRMQCSSPRSDGPGPQSVRRRNFSQVSISACLDQTTTAHMSWFSLFSPPGTIKTSAGCSISLGNCFCCSSGPYRVL